MSKGAKKVLFWLRDFGTLLFAKRAISAQPPASHEFARRGKAIEAAMSKLVAFVE